MRAAAAGAVGATLVTALAAVPPARAAEPSPEPVRILIVGDSVTQGSAGDWTWRYRLWRDFRAADVAVDFVGPRQDLWDNLADVPGSTAYVDPAFDRDHAARWGMQVEVMDVPIEDLVSEHHPDVIVEMLGVNDLIWSDRSPQTVAARIGRLVDDARSADPSIDVVLAEATQHWFPGVPELNALLDQVAATTSTEESAVVVAEAAESYDALADTWDNSHPNARGEVRIAAAIADALHALGVGPPAARPLRMPPVGPRSPAALTAVAGDGRVTLRWTGPPGATAQYVWGRDATAGERWWRIPWPQVAVGQWTGNLLTNGHRYQYRVQPVKGDDEPQGAVFSDVVTVTPLPPLAAPRGLRAAAGRRCAVLTWHGSAYANRYRLELRRGDRWLLLGRTARTRYVARRLPRAAAWSFRITPTHGAVTGTPAKVRVRPARSGGPCP